MSLPALHLLTLTDPTDVKRALENPEGPERDDDLEYKSKQAVRVIPGEDDDDDFWGLNDPPDDQTKKEGKENSSEADEDFWGLSDDETEGEGEETEEVPKDANDYKEPEHPKVLILDFDHTMHQGIVKKYTTSTYASMANKDKTEEEEEKYHSELAKDADNAKKGKHSRVGVAGMTSDKPLFEQLTQEEYVELFGGQEEIDRMQEFFNNLENQHVYSYILTFSPEAAVKKALEAVDLIKWFTDPEPNKESGNKVYGKEFFDESEAEIKAAGGTGLDKSAGVLLILDQLFQAYQEELPTQEERSKVIAVYVDDDYENVLSEGSGVVPVVFKDPEYNMHRSTGIVHKWQNMQSQKKKDQMNSFPEPFHNDFEDIERAFDLEGWVKELSSVDLSNITEWWNRNNRSDILTTDELKEEYALADRKTSLMWCQRARALYWEKMDGPDDDEE